MTAAHLDTFLESIPESPRLAMRTLAHAWEGGGGGLQVGRMATRLVGSHTPPYTAGTLYRARADRGPTLELCRPILAAHGVSAEAFIAWCDERPELTAHGFDATARFPEVDLQGMGATTLARLALGLRDLALLLHRTS